MRFQYVLSNTMSGLTTAKTKNILFKLIQRCLQYVLSNTMSELTTAKTKNILFTYKFFQFSTIRYFLSCSLTTLAVQLPAFYPFFSFRRRLTLAHTVFFVGFFLRSELEVRLCVPSVRTGAARIRSNEL